MGGVLYGGVVFGSLRHVLERANYVLVVVWEGSWEHMTLGRGC